MPSNKRAKTFSPVFPNGIRKEVAIGSRGHILVEDSGPSMGGPRAQYTALCLPGIGDVRQSYRFLAPRLTEQGFRVLVADLRGAGDSSAAFASYTPLDVSADAWAVLDAFSVSSNVVLFANSLAAASALHLAASHPQLVSAVVCLAPVARDLPQDSSFRLLSHVLFLPPWGAPLWVSYFSSLFTLHRPPDLDAYKAALGAKLQERGRLSALGQLVRGSKTPCFQEAGKVRCPVLLLHGEKDPDFSDPRKEAEEVKAALTAARSVRVEVFAGVGHYPHVEDPDGTLECISSFLDSVGPT